VDETRLLGYPEFKLEGRASFSIMAGLAVERCAIAEMAN
jgi:hypothetical protein